MALLPRQLRQTVLVLGAVAALGLAIAVFPAGQPAISTTAAAGPVPGAAPVDALAAPAQSALDEVLGAGHSVVTASAVYGSGSNTRTLRYDHRPAVVLDQSTVTAPGYRSSVTDNGVGSSVQTRSIPAGGVQRLSVAVVVDSNLRPPPSLSTIKKQVSAAMGLQARRGDRITVARLPMAAAASSPALVISGPRRYEPYLRSGVAAAAALVLLLTAAVRARRRRP